MRVAPPIGRWGASISGLPRALKPKHKGFCSILSDQAFIGKVCCSNGTAQYKFYCGECGGKAGGNLPHDFVSQYDPAGIPTLTVHEIMSCERCGNLNGSEVHHWAPRHLFGNDCEEWPKSYLCRECHALWHKVVTPNMSGN